MKIPFWNTIVIKVWCAIIIMIQLELNNLIGCYFWPLIKRIHLIFGLDQFKLQILQWVSFVRTALFDLRLFHAFQGTVDIKQEKKTGSITDDDLIKLRDAEKKKIDWKNKLYLAPLTTVCYCDICQTS